MLADGNDMSFGWRIVIEGAGSKASSPARSAGAPENRVIHGKSTPMESRE